MAHAPAAHGGDKYYIPHGSHWPIVGSLALFTTMIGASTWLNGLAAGPWIFCLGLSLVAFMFFGWFGTVIDENQRGLYNAGVDRSFRMGMMWFIFSEVMFFGAFFGALYYTHELSVPWLAGEGSKFVTNLLLWPGFEGGWPTDGPGNVGGEFTPMHGIGIPSLNTAILLTSGVTITIAHHALRAGHRGTLKLFLALTVLLGFIFVGFQAYEYHHAYEAMNLRLDTGVYGSTFYMLTGFHGLHVTVGAIMLLVVWFRVMRGHFTPTHHFAFEGAAWYWHFVDVVWLGLYIFVYWM
jgi:cytochrome c oxidase subunit 3